MRAGRTLTAFATAAGLALASLVGCTGEEDDGWEDDSVAAYVGEVEITEGQVDEVADDLRGALGSEVQRELDQLAEDGEMDDESLAAHEQRRLGELDDQVSVTRTRVLEMRILTEAGTRYGEQEGLDVPPPALEYHADELGLAQDNRYVQVVGEFFAVLGVLQSAAGSAAPTEADQREVYDNLVAEGLTTASFEEAREVLTEELMGQQVAIRNLLREAVGQAEARVNPDYDLSYRVPVPVGSGESWLALPLDTTD